MRASGAASDVAAASAGADGETCMCSSGVRKVAMLTSSTVCTPLGERCSSCAPRAAFASASESTLETDAEAESASLTARMGTCELSSSNDAPTPRAPPAECGALTNESESCEPEPVTATRSGVRSAERGRAEGSSARCVWEPEIEPEPEHTGQSSADTLACECVLECCPFLAELLSAGRRFTSAVSMSRDTASSALLASS